jgi:hypothetical protein
MKNNILKFSLFAVIILTFYGCPIGLDYPVAEPGSEKIDPNILGTWTNEDPEAAVVKVKIEKKDEYTFSVTVLEKGDLYSFENDKFKGWIGTISGQKILFFQNEEDNQYYHYVIKGLKNNLLETCDLTLLDGGKDAVVSTESLRQEVLSSMKLEEFCQETEKWNKD